MENPFRKASHVNDDSDDDKEYLDSSVATEAYSRIDEDGVSGKKTFCLGLYDTRKLLIHSLVTALPLIGLWVLYIVDVIAVATTGDTLLSHEYCVRPRNMESHSMLGMLAAPFLTRPEEWYLLVINTFGYASMSISLLLSVHIAEYAVMVVLLFPVSGSFYWIAEPEMFGPACIVGVQGVIWGMFGLVVLSLAFQFNWRILVVTAVGLVVYIGMYIGVAEGYAHLVVALRARATTTPGPTTTSSSSAAFMLTSMQSLTTTSDSIMGEAVTSSAWAPCIVIMLLSMLFGGNYFFLRRRFCSKKN